jgi:ParB family chromosome partitioning protein
MAKVFAIANQKGGVGKTTTCINLAASLVATKRRVLLIDLDPQGNATMGSGVDKHGLENSVYDLLIGECDLAQAMHFSEHGGYQLLPANRDLTAAEVVLLEMQMKESRLRSALAPIRENYDYILIDCPPSLSMLTLNALVAADGVIIPMQCEYFALEGLSDLVDNIKRIAELLNPNLKVEGLLRTMYDPRLSLMNDVSAQLKEHFGDQLYDTVIPRNIRLAEAPSYGMPALAYDKSSRGAVAYLALAGEMVRRQRKNSRIAAVKKRGLGRGLDALLSGPSVSALEEQAVQADQRELQHLPLDLLQRGKYQPRRDMDPQALEELAQSIKAQGVMQPIVVRPIGSGRYEIIAGERRWRASQQAGQETIPAMVRDVPDETAIAIALIENIQREDLNPIEEAVALQRLQTEFQLTQQQVAEAVGKSRVTVANLLRLISLPEVIKTMLSHGDLEMGHARALLGLPDNQQVEGARHVVARGLTVRQTEALVRQWLSGKPEPVEPSKPDPDIARLEQRLAERLGSAVQIRHGKKGKGQLVIGYNSLDELQGVLAHIR